MNNFENLTITDYVNIVKRRFLWIVATFILVGAAAGVYVWRMPSIYQSETIIAVAGRMLPEEYIGSITRENPADQIAFVKQRLESRTLLERIVEEFQLLRPGISMEQAVRGVQNSKEIAVIPPNAFRLTYVSTSPVMAQAIARRLAESVMQLNASLRRDKVDVADQFLADQLREAASDVAAAEVKVHEFIARRFPGLPAQGVDVAALTSLRQELATMDTSLQNVVEQRKSLERRLEEQRQLKLLVVDEKPQPTETRPSPVSPIPVKASPLEERLLGKQAELAAASTRYTSSHPDVVRLIREVSELEKEVRSVRASAPAPPVETPTNNVRQPAVVLPEVESVDFAEAETKFELEQTIRDINQRQEAKRAIQSKIDVYNARLNLPPAVAQEHATLQQDYESAKQRYNLLSNRSLNLGLAARVDASADNHLFKVIDEASLPQNPISPNRIQLTAFGFLAALLLGVGVAFARELTDSTFKDEEDAAAKLNLPVLVSIPFVNQKRSFRRAEKNALVRVVPKPEDASEYGPGRVFELGAAQGNLREVVLDPNSIAGEQYRLLRAKLSSMQKQQGLKSLLISSALPNDGKTFVACCLAGILAQEPNKKVLLIDADLRTGNAGKALGVQGAGDRGGLSGMLRGTERLHELEFAAELRSRYTDSDVLTFMPDFEEVLMKCKDVNLYFWPAGHLAENPAEILSSPELERLVRQAERFFDWVIIDSPPLIGIVDAHIIAPLCGATLVVVNAEKTPAPLVKDAIQKIGSDHICGVLMNRVRNLKTVKYYGRYYRAKRS